MTDALMDDLMDLIDESIEDGRRLASFGCEPPAWWTEDRMRALHYGQGTAEISVALALREILRRHSEHRELPMRIKVYVNFNRQICHSWADVLTIIVNENPRVVSIRPGHTNEVANVYVEK